MVVSSDEGHRMMGQLWSARRAVTNPNAPGVFTDQAAAIAWLPDRRAAPAGSTMRA